MTAAHDSRAEALKEAAVLRSLADAVASPVVAGRKSRKGLTVKQRGQWQEITDCVVTLHTWSDVAHEGPECLAGTWKDICRGNGIGYTKLPVVGWMIPIPGFWGLMFQLLLELAKLWIESRQQGRVSER